VPHRIAVDKLRLDAKVEAMWNPVHGSIRLFCLSLGGLLLFGSCLSANASGTHGLQPTAVRADPGWYLRGGMLTGHFLGPQAQGDWPLWMQALIGGRQDVSAAELRRADLAKIPDAFLAKGIQRLEERRIFEPRLLRQATAIGYTARAAEWQEAKSVYQVAYVKALGLPGQDPLTASRLMTQLAYRNEFDLLRQAMEAAQFPRGILASFLRLVDLRAGCTVPSESWVLDPARPAVERLPVLRALPQPAEVGRLLASFRGTDQLDLAVWHALSGDWIALDSPWVTEALLLRKQPVEDTLWFLNRPEERVSDLLWLRAMDALGRGDRSTAVAHARAILARYPQSMYVGHASFLLAHLDPAFPPSPQPTLRIPGDITLFNAASIRLQLRIPESPWPVSVQALADGNRFDLILARADPEQEEALFLRAAFRAGQQDLVARHQSLGRRTTLETVPFLFPVYLKPLVERLIREEGLSYAVDPVFVLAMIKNESIFEPEARSGSEACG